MIQSITTDNFNKLFNLNYFMSTKNSLLLGSAVVQWVFQEC